MIRPSKLDALRGQIATLKAEQSELSGQKRSRTEVAAMLDGHIANWQATGMQSMARDLTRAANGESVDTLSVRSSAPVGASPGVVQINFSLGPLLVTLLGADAVKKAFSAVLDAVPEGMDRAQREDRLRAIAAELDLLETEEEALIVAAGGAIERRPDARPEIILAVV